MVIPQWQKLIVNHFSARLSRHAQRKYYQRLLLIVSCKAYLGSTSTITKTITQTSNLAQATLTQATTRIDVISYTDLVIYTTTFDTTQTLHDVSTAYTTTVITSATATVIAKKAREEQAPRPHLEKVTLGVLEQRAQSCKARTTRPSHIPTFVSKYCKSTVYHLSDRLIRPVPFQRSVSDIHHSSKFL